MPITTGRIPTQSASRYLVQLCKHWSHKFAVEWDEARGTIPFDEARTCRLTAEPGALLIEIEAPEDQMACTQRVVFEHLTRFAFREELAPPEWTQAQLTSR